MLFGRKDTQKEQTSNTINKFIADNSLLKDCMPFWIFSNCRLRGLLTPAAECHNWRSLIPVIRLEIVGQDAAIIVDKSSGIYLKFQFKVPDKTSQGFGLSSRYSSDCLLHVILNLLHVIAYGNNGSTFDISTQVLSCVFYNHFHRFHIASCPKISREQGGLL